MSIIEVTAEQLAWSNGRDKPTEKDQAEAAVMVQRWNESRIKNGLKPLE